MYIVCLYKYCLLSILAGVILVSSFGVVPKSSYPSNVKRSSRLVAWSLNCSSAASSNELTLASFKTPADTFYWYTMHTNVCISDNL